MSFTLAIVGRPNVGKSTLFNRLSGRRQALASPTPGMTRDRREGEGAIGDLTFRMIDTAGLEDAAAGSLQARMTAQSKQAIENADAVLMLVDAREGVTPVDKHFAKLIRSMKKPVVLAVNKAEGKLAASAVGEAYALGLGDPVPISAEHGEGLADLYEALAKFERPNPQSLMPNASLKIAIVGRPNVGKSTLMNAILGEERVLTGPEAGITRDAIAVAHDDIVLVDTAGMRKKANIDEETEKLAVGDSLAAIRSAQVVVCVFDAEQPLEKQDNAIAALAEQEGRAVVIAVNKWDKVEDEEVYMKAFRQRLSYVLPQLDGVSIVPVSAERKYNIRKLLAECRRAYDTWNKEFSTGELNRWLEKALEKHAPPLIDGRRLKIRYMTQKTARPPTFIMFANLSEIPDHYLRYLIGSMREWFDLPGTPIRIKFRKGENPYAKKKKK